MWVLVKWAGIPRCFGYVCFVRVAWEGHTGFGVHIAILF